MKVKCTSLFECKFQRSSILEALAKVQAPEELFNQLTSITSLQTKGLKRHVSEENKGVNSIAGSKKRRLRLMLEEQDANDIKTKLPKDPNVVGVEVIYKVKKNFT